MRALVALAVLAITTSVSAQPATLVGKPLPSPDLAAGTVAVRVVDGSFTTPHSKIAVTLVVDGVSRVATTNAEGRATFDQIKPGASVQAHLASSEPLATSQTFVLPADTGVRLMLSTQPWIAIDTPTTAARETSGHPVVDETVSPGTAEVHVTYNDLADPKPPANIVVSLVGYASDDRVTVVTAKTDRTGLARFFDLDVTGATAYFALAELPRKVGADRLMTQPIIVASGRGAHVVLSGELRTATAAPIDELVTQGPATPKNTLHVDLEGVVDASTQVEVIDAATHKVVKHGAATDKALALDLPFHANQVLYAEAIAHGSRYRSMPFQTVADRGARIQVYVYPRVLPQYQFMARPYDDLVQISAKISLNNNSWIPYAEASPMRLPLPRGATHVEVYSDTFATWQSGVLELTGPLPPGGRELDLAFDVPATTGTIAWSLDLPYGAFQSTFIVEHQPGVTLEAPPTMTVETKTLQTGTFLTISNISILPKQAMVMTLHLPKPGLDAAMVHACRALDPDHSSPLLGKPMPDGVLTQLDGKKLRLSSLRGKLVIVNLMASWDSLSSIELPKLEGLLSKIVGLAIVLVASDSDQKDVTRMVGKTAPFRVILDPPPDIPGANIGAITSSWGVKLLPESFVLDRKGVVRFYFSNSRNWSSADALACVKAVAASP